MTCAEVTFMGPWARLLAPRDTDLGNRGLANEALGDRELRDREGRRNHVRRHFDILNDNSEVCRLFCLCWPSRPRAGTRRDPYARCPIRTGAADRDGLIGPAAHGAELSK